MWQWIDFARCVPSCGSSVADKLFGGDDDYGNNSEIVKWPTPRDQAINILLLNKNAVCWQSRHGVVWGHIDFAMCEINFWKISASHSIWWWWRRCEQLQITVFELMCLYYKCHSSFRDCLRDLVFGARCSYYICRKLLQMNLPCIHNRNSKKTMLKFGQVLRKKKDFDCINFNLSYYCINQELCT